MRFFRFLMIILILLCVFSGVCHAKKDSYRELEVEVEEFTLENGMEFLVVERHASPQVACRLSIRAGSALELAGASGMAHMVEHMMFKGTQNFGTLDPEKDKRLRREIDAAYQKILAERTRRDPDESVIRSNLKKMQKLISEAQEIFVPQALSSQLGKNGAVGVNAFTTRDQTQYTASVPSDMLEQWFSIQSEQLFEPAWRMFYLEKEVVQREWAFRYVNNPQGAAWLGLNSAAYTAHPYRNPVIGWKTDMKYYSTEDARAFHDEFYNPANTVCVLVGDLTVENARDLAETYFGRYPAGKRAPELVTEEPEQHGPREVVRMLKGARRPLVRIGYHGTSMGTDDFYALDALTMVLSEGRGARLSQNVKNKGLAVEAWAANPDNRYGGMFILGGTPDEQEGLDLEKMDEKERQQHYIEACRDLQDVLVSEVEKLKEAPLPEAELQRIKKLNRRSFLDRIRHNESLAGTLSTLEVQVGWEYFNTYLEEMEQVGPKDIMSAAQKYTKESNRTTLFLIPGGKEERGLSSRYKEDRSGSDRSAEVLSHVDTSTNHSEYPTPEGWKHPLSFDRDPVMIEYPDAETAAINGAKVFYLPDRELPLVDLKILVKAGAVDVAKQKTGLTRVLEECLVRGGTRSYSPRRLAMALDKKAIRVSVSAKEEVTEITLSVLKEDWDKGLEILEEILVRPSFDEEILEAVKKEETAQLRRQAERAHAVAARELEIWHFRGHPYGRDPLTGLKTIPLLTQETLKGFLQTYFEPSNMVVAVSGRIEKEAALEGLKGLFKALDGKTPIPAPERELKEPEGHPPVLALIHKPGQVQSQIVMGLPGLERKDPDYWKLNLLVDIMGGSNSMIFKRLRSDLGLVYAAGFFQTYKWKAGMLKGYIGCKADRTSEAIQETVGIMERLQKSVPKEAMEEKRLDVLNSFVFNTDTPKDLVQAYARYYLRNESLDTLENIQRSYLEATAAELEGLAARFLRPGRLQIFIVADKNTKVSTPEEGEATLGQDLKNLARRLGIGYRELPLR